MELPEDWTAEQMLDRLPAGTAAVAAKSPEGRALLRQRLRGVTRLIFNEVKGAARRGHRGRRAQDVIDHYEPDYAGEAKRVAESYDDIQRPILFRLADQLAKIEGRHALSLSARQVGDIAAALAPSSVAEIGCGHGRVLHHIAARLPEAECFGYELTKAGVEMAQQLQALDLPQTAYGRHYGITPDNLPSVRRTRFETASAFDLPVEDGRFDLVYTNAALEQMHDGLPQALSEIRRISRKYVLLHEPFADFNDLPSRAFLWSRNYFRLHSTDLRRYGLEPVRYWHNLPVKPTFAYGLVLFELR